MVFIKDESEDVKIKETFRVKHEDTEEQTKMAFIKDESEDTRIEETFRKIHHDFKNGEKFSQKTKSNSYFTCHQCGKSFTQKGSLKSHMIVHTGKKPYTCTQCGKSFTYKHTLNDHMRIHTGEKPFNCQQCGKHFTQKQNLTVHMRIHSGEKPYTCHQCGQSFRHNKNLYTHIRSHAREIPFTCKLCGKKFSNKEILNAHVRIDTENEFTCQHIQRGKSFRFTVILNHHMRNHSRENGFMSSVMEGQLRDSYAAITEGSNPHPNTVFGKKMTCTTKPLKLINTR
uniref:C2H2-type domain-containing protein n=1 Tax=Sinocyclocheilus grahami TaxID=75366 RepID=A0A672N5G3_SINGR